MGGMGGGALAQDSCTRAGHTDETSMLNPSPELLTEASLGSGCGRYLAHLFPAESGRGCKSHSDRVPHNRLRENHY